MASASLGGWDFFEGLLWEDSFRPGLRGDGLRHGNSQAPPSRKRPPFFFLFFFHSQTPRRIYLVGLQGALHFFFASTSLPSTAAVNMPSGDLLSLRPKAHPRNAARCPESLAETTIGLQSLPPFLNKRPPPDNQNTLGRILPKSPLPFKAYSELEEGFEAPNAGIRARARAGVRARAGARAKAGATARAG